MKLTSSRLKTEYEWTGLPPTLMRALIGSSKSSRLVDIASTSPVPPSKFSWLSNSVTPLLIMTKPWCSSDDFSMYTPSYQDVGNPSPSPSLVMVLSMEQLSGFTMEIPEAWNAQKRPPSTSPNCSSPYNTEFTLDGTCANNSSRLTSRRQMIRRKRANECKVSSSYRRKFCLSLRLNVQILLVKVSCILSTMSHWNLCAEEQRYANPDPKAGSAAVQNNWIIIDTSASMQAAMPSSVFKSKYEAAPICSVRDGIDTRLAHVS